MCGVKRLVSWLALVVICAGWVAPSRPEASSSSCVVRATIAGIVTSATADYLEEAITDAAGCEALLLVVDTPGGAMAATRRIVQRLLTSPVPVITFVSPSGARAGSAGMFIVIAGHVAAMAPGSNIGAAHPVLSTGADPDEVGEEMARKVENDAAALARAVAQQRGRNADWVEDAVRKSLSATAHEAAEGGVIDLVAPSQATLLAELDGRVVTVAERPRRLSLAAPRIIDDTMSLPQRVRVVLGNPTLVYVLFLLGLLGLVMELYHPGMLVPGAVGALALLLAAVGLDLLPVNAGAVVLVVVGAGLLVAELFVTSYGALTVVGFGLVVLGSMFLLDRSDPDFFADPSVRLSWGAVIPLAAVLTATVVALGWRARSIRRRRAATGAEAMIGARALAVSEIGPSEGHVRVAGERWSAVSKRPIPAGAKVDVVKLEGLKLVVEPSDEEDEEHAA